MKKSFESGPHYLGVLVRFEEAQVKLLYYFSWTKEFTCILKVQFWSVQHSFSSFPQNVLNQKNKQHRHKLTKNFNLPECLHKLAWNCPQSKFLPLSLWNYVSLDQLMTEDGAPLLAVRGSCSQTPDFATLSLSHLSDHLHLESFSRISSALSVQKKTWLSRSCSPLVSNWWLSTASVCTYTQQAAVVKTASLVRAVCFAVSARPCTHTLIGLCNYLCCQFRGVSAAHQLEPELASVLSRMTPMCKQWAVGVHLYVFSVVFITFTALTFKLGPNSIHCRVQYYKNKDKFSLSNHVHITNSHSWVFIVIFVHI